MSVLCIPTRRLGVALALGALAVAPGTLASGAALAAVTGPNLRTDQRCYVLGTPIQVSGSGFAPQRTYVLTIDEVYVGRASTDSSGALASQPLPRESLPAGYAQSVEHLEASDGTSTADTSFTLTRPAGAHFGTLRGSGTSVRAPLEVWDYGVQRPVYLHWVSPTGAVHRTALLGRTGGQCGYLHTSAIRVFPFLPARGTWTFQIDTRRAYAPRPGAPVTRIRVTVR